MPLVSASNENQTKYCALMFLGVSLKIAGRSASKNVTYYKCPWLVFQKKYAM